MKKLIIYRILALFVLGIMVDRAAAQMTQWETDSLNNIIEGRVIDSATHEPVPFATILVKGSHIGVFCDLKGRFKLHFSDSLLKTSYSLIIAAAGFKTRYEIVETSSHKKIFKLKKEEDINNCFVP